VATPVLPLAPFALSCRNYTPYHVEYEDGDESWEQLNADGSTAEAGGRWRQAREGKGGQLGSPKARQQSQSSGGGKGKKASSSGGGKGSGGQAVKVEAKQTGRQQRHEAEEPKQKKAPQQAKGAHQGKVQQQQAAAKQKGKKGTVQKQKQKQDAAQAADEPAAKRQRKEAQPQKQQQQPRGPGQQPAAAETHTAAAGSRAGLTALVSCLEEVAEQPAAAAAGLTPELVAAAIALLPMEAEKVRREEGSGVLRGRLGWGSGQAAAH